MKDSFRNPKEAPSSWLTASLRHSLPCTGFGPDSRPPSYPFGLALDLQRHGVHAPGDAHAQARRCLEIIERALHDLGATMADVVRTPMFTTDITRWAEYGRAHREFFAQHPPATTMVEVKALIDPEMLIEIEADAVVMSPP